MARSSSTSKDGKYLKNFDPATQAYRWGRSGVEVQTDMVETWLSWHNKSNLNTRAENIRRMVAGADYHHLSAAVFGALIFLTALYVDYNIINEFWSRALSNEYGEVPPALANTVAAKSMQVVFGTLAIHYLMSHAGSFGRGMYSLLIFLVSVAMIIGIGMLWANNSLPAGSQVFGFDVNASAHSVDNFMKGLGVSPPKPAPTPAEVKFLTKYQLLIWLFSLSVIFLVVASIGAMALHSAMRGFSAMTGGPMYEDSKELLRGHNMRDGLQHANADKQLYANNLEAFAKAKLVEFLSIYTDGLLDGWILMPGRRAARIAQANKAVKAIDISAWCAETRRHDEGEASKEGNDGNVINLRRRPAAAQANESNNAEASSKIAAME